MKFATLTKAQQRFIVSAIIHNPALAEKTEVSRAEILDAYWALRNARTGNEPKVGLPNWLMNTAKTGRGSYVFPAPTDAELQDYNSSSVTTTVKKNTSATANARKRLDAILEKGDTVDPLVNISDEEFLAELQEAGIDV
jgi:hypothetical protein